MTGRMGRPGTWGPTGVRERTSASNWAKPLLWNRRAADGLLPDGRENPDGHRPRIFCASLADVFEPRPEVEPWRRELFGIISTTPNLDWLVLTKRPDLAHEWLRDFYATWTFVVTDSEGRIPLDFDTITRYDYLPNLWIGTSIESTAYTWRADLLRRIPAAVRFLSCEPLLGSLFTMPFGATGSGGEAGHGDPGLPPLSDSAATDGTPDGAPAGEPRSERGRGLEDPGRATLAPLDLTGIDWVIVGGESGGRHARPMHPEWAREIRDAVLDVGGGWDLSCGDPDCCGHEWVRDDRNPRPALHFKQWGSWRPDGRGMVYAGASPKSAGKLLDGVEWCEFPERHLVPA